MGIQAHKRRFNPSSTSSKDYDSDTGFCSIEFFMAAKDPYRHAPGNRIPVPWPYTQNASSLAAQELVQDLEDGYEKVLIEHNITLLQTFVVSLGRRGYPQDQKDTLIIITRDENTEKWKDAATAIYALVEKAARPTGLQMRVEIRNKEKMYRDVSSVIPPNTDIHRALMEVEDLVAERVQSICAGQWNSIAFQMRGPAEQISLRRPTVMITTAPGTKFYWATVEEYIQKALEGVSSFDVAIHVEVLPGLFQIGPNTTLHPRPFVIRNLLEVARNGSSIGPRLNSFTAGSLGVWVYFQPHGETEKKKCFLTCYHVTAPGDPEHQNDNDVNGIGLLGRTVEHRISIDYPAPFDAIQTKEILTQDIAEGNDHHRKLSRTLEVMDQYADAGGIGYVEYASGHSRTSDDRRLDWALVVLNDPSYFSQNKPPPANFTETELWNGRIDYDVTPDEVISKIGMVTPGAWAAKMGRTSQVTCGEVNSMRAKVPWANQRMSREVQIVSQPGGRQFAEDGDSGAMVLNQEKEWIGMVIGNDINLEAGYVTPVQDLLDDIKKRTGGTISLA